ncbi:putative CRISPR-associated protein [Ureibacillus thermosphaericus]|uniref:Putative CRISPR-associated protein (TIGR02619 family) n=1 Tax=Ureibacillus thermosphaericus TaxID=51173 RepID=A0A840PWJ8_URETH|nr:putative CRISPR-associated protein [Ureibacillus thermosphaericus]MBB5149082.1 putative CRISPR-associated protein (TIGR02619 family) [Ureibacillus thermosphaericus]NKZ31846.1 putative CRISPR-associated protein [Ureibacillus thermosphaericus]
MKKNTIIATVGTSLLGGLNRNGIDWNLPIEQIVKKIQELENNTNICAEISSIHSMIHENILVEKENLYLLASDTVEGEKIKLILKSYFASLFRNVHVFTIEHLNGQNAKQFTEEGLRNLVKIIVYIVKTVPNREEDCVINATGGYKAQISFAGLIGQVLKIPVYYQFEGFSSVVQLPTMPVVFDYQLWLKHFKLFKELYDLGIASTKLLPSNIKLKELDGLVEETNGQLRLSSTGLLLHEVLWNRYKDENFRVDSDDTSVHIR